MEKLDKKGLTEKQAIEAYQKKNYPKPALTADIVIFAKDEDKYQVLLIKRGGHPYIDCWALPGGFANQNEEVEITAKRELYEETSVDNVELIPVGFYSKPNRDPRGWVVSCAFMAVVDKSLLKPKAGDDANEVAWFDISINEGVILKDTINNIIIKVDDKDSKENLAFDHAVILKDAINKLEK